MLDQRAARFTFARICITEPEISQGDGDSLFIIIRLEAHCLGEGFDVVEVRIEQLLEERGKTFYWLAKETGIGYTTLWRLRHEEAKSISFDFLERICRALECQPGDLLTLIDYKTENRRIRKSTRKGK